MKRTLILLTLLLLTTSPALCVPLQWDANQDASFYVVYWGENPGEYTGHSEEITTTEYDTGDLDPKYKFFAVKAFNPCGNSSDYSDEICYSPEQPKVQNFRVNVNVEITVTVDKGPE